MRRLDPTDLAKLLRLCSRLARGRHLTVLRVPAAVAQHERVLAERRQVHELVCPAATHDADVGPDGDHWQAASGEDLEVRVVMRPVLGVEARLVEIEAVGVLHGELAGADHPGPRAGIVSPLDLDLEDESRELSIRADLARGKAGDHLLVGHGEHHAPVAPVLKARELGTDLLIPAALLPELCGVHDGQRHLHAPDGRQLLAEDLFDVHH